MHRLKYSLIKNGKKCYSYQHTISDFGPEFIHSQNFLQAATGDTVPYLALALG